MNAYGCSMPKPVMVMFSAMFIGASPTRRGRTWTAAPSLTKVPGWTVLDMTGDLSAPNARLFWIVTHPCSIRV